VGGAVLDTLHINFSRQSPSSAHRALVPLFDVQGQSIYSLKLQIENMIHQPHGRTKLLTHTRHYCRAIYTLPTQESRPDLQNHSRTPGLCAPTPTASIKRQPPNSLPSPINKSFSINITLSERLLSTSC
jgi:hypothetical protein